MISFINDYSEVAHPKVLENLALLSNEKNPGYSNDKHSKIATNLIKSKIDDNNAYVQILVIGTQTNLIAAAAFLRPHEALITVETGHVHDHEVGSIESTGHKCITVKGESGKITIDDLKRVCSDKYWGNAGILNIKPKMVYISQTTEVGTFYTKEELTQIRKFCDDYGLYLYCDGARLASALDCSDVTLKDLAKLCDAFYIGGTKNGALMGEAMVIINDKLKEDFFYIAKQRGGILSKGFLLGIQFETLMSNNLYEKIGEHQNKMANLLREGLKKLNIEIINESKTNQIFAIISNNILDKLRNKFAWETINTSDDSTEIRLVTSWSTKKEEVNSFINSISEYLENEVC
ncbi:aminotransferase class I/II-fold pyridoxal phosphate-dependent enzyme [Anaerococcus sp. AGMB00486]|uniref:Aminotransferase class I/II-fold pyridoxal phosphate-dependent enzyme n=1 Tax=Anaerococcus faecalis TaxID=2742993 RepID=A0ABX2NA01_9FIRM|nr:aminotransferase class I/II-fold pyridoxal phosphate-dependent enzyme [Anaerococcus faecalis]NVF11540.1 aminotransferase class I/II-fold pyridoxal phosphate-dependent enzyme [Anaerococcus faecalis]